MKAGGTKAHLGKPGTQSGQNMTWKGSKERNPGSPSTVPGAVKSATLGAGAW